MGEKELQMNTPDLQLSPVVKASGQTTFSNPTCLKC